MDLRNLHFRHFLFDNADYNSRTVDGKNTFHAMRGIQCIAPKTDIISNNFLSRNKSRPSAIEMGKFGTVDLQSFEKSNKKPDATKIQNFVGAQINSKMSPLDTDLLWLYGTLIYGR